MCPCLSFSSISVISFPAVSEEHYCVYSYVYLALLQGDRANPSLQAQS